MNANNRISPLFLSLLAQLAGGGIGLLAWRLESFLASSSFFQPLGTVWTPAFMAGFSAAMIGRFIFRLPSWWIIINAVFIPATIGAMTLDLPGWIYLLAFILTLAVFWNVRTDRVPLYLTNKITWQALSGLLTENDKHRFIDLGCGLSGALRFLAQNHPEKSFVGVESAPLPFLISKLRQWLNPLPNLKIIHADIWGLNLSGYDAAYCFLSPAPMTRLYEKVKSEMSEGSMMISNSFDVPEHPPAETITVDDGRKTRLLIWRL